METRLNYGKGFVIEGGSVAADGKIGDIVQFRQKLTT